MLRREFFKTNITFDTQLNTALYTVFYCEYANLIGSIVLVIGSKNSFDFCFGGGGTYAVTITDIGMSTLTLRAACLN